jgi:hypothetical protein
MAPRLLHPIASTKMTELMHVNSRAVILDTSNDLINRIPAHKIIFDFPVVVLLLFTALYKALIFALSCCWQAMVRTKSRLHTQDDRIRTTRGTTITTTFKPTNMQPRITKLRAMERQILRNLGIIQQFNVSNESGPTSSKQALFQRHKYQAIKENCDLTKQTINHALSLSNANEACIQAYQGTEKNAHQ